MRKPPLMERLLPLSIQLVVFVAVFVAFATVDLRYGYPSTCYEHKESTKAGFVGIPYGLRAAIPGPLRDRSKFPNANLSGPGGCIVTHHKFALVRYCPRCREVERETRPE